MKKNLLLFLLAGLPWLADAQIKNRDWVLVGGERIRGSYTGISPAVADDRYQLQNLATWRFEFATSRRILFADLSWFPIKMIGILNDYHASTYTKERMMKVQNRTNFRFGCLYYLNKNKEANSRFVLGWQVDWRYMGLERLDQPGDNGFHVGSLEAKDRVGAGAQLAWVRQWKWAYSRVGVSVDGSPQVLKSLSVYPEALVVFNYGNIGLYALGTFRQDWLWGNNRPDQKVQPLESSSVHRAWRLEIGLAIDGGFHGK
jgi:hypothetical protein